MPLIQRPFACPRRHGTNNEARRFKVFRVFRECVFPPFGVTIDLYMRKSSAKLSCKRTGFIHRYVRSSEYVPPDICGLQLLVIDEIQCPDAGLGKSHCNVRSERTTSEYHNRRFLQRSLRGIKAATVDPVVVDANHRMSPEIVTLGKSVESNIHGHRCGTSKPTQRIFRVTVLQKRDRDEYGSGFTGCRQDNQIRTRVQNVPAKRIVYCRRVRRNKCVEFCRSFRIWRYRRFLKFDEQTAAQHIDLASM